MSGGFYTRLTHLAKAGEWQQALALMRLTGLPAMCRAFRTTELRNGHYEMVFRFASIEEMHAADREWHEFRAASAGGTAETAQTGSVHEHAVPAGGDAL